MGQGGFGRLLCAAALALLCVGCGGGETHPVGPRKTETLSSQAREHAERAVAAQRRGDIEAALEEAMAALELAPENPRLYRFVSKLFTDAGLDDAGIAFFDEFARRHPARPEPWLYRGYHEYHLHLWEEALRSFAKAAELDPTDAQPHQRRGLIYQYMGRFDEALEAFRVAYELDPSAEHAARLAEALRKAGRYDEAGAVAGEALARDDSHAGLHLEAARLALRRGDDEAAEGHLRRALEIEPSLAAAHKELAAILFRTGRDEEARQEKLLAERLADWSATRNFFLSWLRRSPEDPLVPLRLAELELAAGRAEQALVWFERAARLGAPRERVAAGQAEALALVGQLEAARRAVARCGEGPRAELARATLLIREGKKEDAAPRLQRVLARVERLDRDAAYRLADRFRELGDMGRWAELMARAATIPRPGVPGTGPAGG